MLYHLQRVGYFWDRIIFYHLTPFDEKKEDTSSSWILFLDHPLNHKGTRNLLITFISDLATKINIMPPLTWLNSCVSKYNSPCENKNVFFCVELAGVCCCGVPTLNYDLQCWQQEQHDSSLVVVVCKIAASTSKPILSTASGSSTSFLTWFCWFVTFYCCGRHFWYPHSVATNLVLTACDTHFWHGYLFTPEMKILLFSC